VFQLAQVFQSFISQLKAEGVAEGEGIDSNYAKIQEMIISYLKDAKSDHINYYLAPQIQDFLQAKGLSLNEMSKISEEDRASLLELISNQNMTTGYNDLQLIKLPHSATYAFIQQFEMLLARQIGQGVELPPAKIDQAI